MKPDTERELIADDPSDAHLREVLQSAPIPAASSLENAVRGRITQRRTQQLLFRSAAAAVCLVAIGGSIRWMNDTNSIPREIRQADAVAFTDRELATLLAPPPVDPLALLDRQQQASYQTLKQLERSR